MSLKEHFFYSLVFFFTAELNLNYSSESLEFGCCALLEVPAFGFYWIDLKQKSPFSKNSFVFLWYDFSRTSPLRFSKACFICIAKLECGYCCMLINLGKNNFFRKILVNLWSSFIFRAFSFFTPNCWIIIDSIDILFSWKSSANSWLTRSGGLGLPNSFARQKVTEINLKTFYYDLFVQFVRQLWHQIPCHLLVQYTCLKLKI